MLHTEAYPELEAYYVNLRAYLRQSISRMAKNNLYLMIFAGKITTLFIYLPWGNVLNVSYSNERNENEPHTHHLHTWNP